MKIVLSMGLLLSHSLISSMLHEVNGKKINYV